jgi:HK97 gp10 family phage protein
VPSQASFGGLSFRWIRPPTGMGDECRRRADALQPALQARMDGLAGEVESYMKSNAPWTDRTGDARAGLKASSRVTGKGGVTLTAYHTVPYGGFLETGTSHMSPYPIIRPALQAHYAKARAFMDEIAG